MSLSYNKKIINNLFIYIYFYLLIFFLFIYIYLFIYILLSKQYPLLEISSKFLTILTFFVPFRFKVILCKKQLSSYVFVHYQPFHYPFNPKVYIFPLQIFFSIKDIHEDEISFCSCMVTLIYTFERKFINKELNQI